MVGVFLEIEVPDGVAAVGDAAHLAEGGDFEDVSEHALEGGAGDAEGAVGGLEEVVGLVLWVGAVGFPAVADEEWGEGGDGEFEFAVVAVAEGDVLRDAVGLVGEDDVFGDGDEGVG